MVLASITEYLFPNSKPSLTDGTGASPKIIPRSLQDAFASASRRDVSQEIQAEPPAGNRPPYLHAMLAGGIGGLTGDMVMHSLDTVKTRQQGDPYRPPKYHTLGNTYSTIFREEGVRLGLYGGVIPAAVGSFIGTCVFFGFYEWTKRLQIDYGIAPTLAYLNSGIIADVAASPLYVPTEVVKTRMQLQGRHNNPHFKSGYNYKHTLDAVRTITRTEGFSALYYGYRATLWRDVPFSAMQFAFYERERQAAKWWSGTSDLSFPIEVFVAMTAGGAAGMISTPLDVVKTRIQTQVNSPKPNLSSPSSNSKTRTPPKTTAQTETKSRPKASSAPSRSSTSSRNISTSSPSAGPRAPGTVILNTSSTIVGLRIIYQTEGIKGWFRGVGPRTVWTSVQSGFMLVLYQYLLKELDKHSPLSSGD